jgi:MoxR-like ATPase
MLVECIAIAWADALGLPKPMPIFLLSGSAGVTDFELFGQTTDYQGTLVWLPGMAALAAQCGGILYIDEANALGERVTSSLHPLVDYRHMFVNKNKAVNVKGQIMAEVVTAHPDLWVIGTYNEGYRGMGEMNEAFINRFRHIPWGYDDKVEKKLVPSAAVRLLGEALRTARAANQRGLRTPVGTRALKWLCEDIDAFGIEMGLTGFVGWWW